MDFYTEEIYFSFQGIIIVTDEEFFFYSKHLRTGIVFFFFFSGSCFLTFLGVERFILVMFVLEKTFECRFILGTSAMSEICCVMLSLNLFGRANSFECKENWKK